MDHFSQAMHLEYAKDNIHFQSLVPMYVATRMTEYSVTVRSVRLFTPSPDTYARHAIVTFGHYRRNTGYAPHSLQASIYLIAVKETNVIDVHSRSLMTLRNKR